MKEGFDYVEITLFSSVRLIQKCLNIMLVRIWLKNKTMILKI